MPFNSKLQFSWEDNYSSGHLDRSCWRQAERGSTALFSLSPFFPCKIFQMCYGLYSDPWKYYIAMFSVYVCVRLSKPVVEHIVMYWQRSWGWVTLEKILELYWWPPWSWGRFNSCIKIQPKNIRWRFVLELMGKYMARKGSCLLIHYSCSFSWIVTFPNSGIRILTFQNQYSFFFFFCFLGPVF